MAPIIFSTILNENCTNSVKHCWQQEEMQNTTPSLIFCEIILDTCIFQTIWTNFYVYKDQNYVMVIINAHFS